MYYAKYYKRQSANQAIILVMIVILAAFSVWMPMYLASLSHF